VLFIIDFFDNYGSDDKKKLLGLIEELFINPESGEIQDFDYHKNPIEYKERMDYKVFINKTEELIAVNNDNSNVEYLKEKDFFTKFYEKCYYDYEKVVNRINPLLDV
jgi:hypothetical protein